MLSRRQISLSDYLVGRVSYDVHMAFHGNDPKKNTLDIASLALNSILPGTSNVVPQTTSKLGPLIIMAIMQSLKAELNIYLTKSELEDGGRDFNTASGTGSPRAWELPSIACQRCGQELLARAYSCGEHYYCDLCYENSGKCDTCSNDVYETVFAMMN